MVLKFMQENNLLQKNIHEINIELSLGHTFDAKIPH